MRFHTLWKWKEKGGKEGDSAELESNVATDFCVIGSKFPFLLVKVIRFYHVDCFWSWDMGCGANGGGARRAIMQIRASP